MTHPKVPEKARSATPYLQVVVDADEDMELAATMAGVSFGDIAGGLLRMWKHCWRKKRAHVPRQLLRALFPHNTDAVTEALVAFEFLDEVTEAQAHVRGAEKRILGGAVQAEESTTQGRRRGGLKAKSNLLQYRTAENHPVEPEAAGPAGAPAEAPANTGSAGPAGTGCPPAEPVRAGPADTGSPGPAAPADVRLLSPNTQHPIPNKEEEGEKPAPAGAARPAEAAKPPLFEAALDFLAWYSDAYRLAFPGRAWSEPEPGGVVGWYGRAIEALAPSGRGDADMRRGALAFFESAHWRPRGCPWPAWVKQWADFVEAAPKPKPQAPEAKCAVPGCQARRYSQTWTGRPLCMPHTGAWLDVAPETAETDADFEAFTTAVQP